MLKTLFILGIAVFLLACGKTVLAKKGDRYIWLEEHSSYPTTQAHWKKYEIKHKTYFGKYSYFNDHFNDYYGDPLGPIVSIWEVTRYLGKEPVFKKCIKPNDPIRIAKKYGLESPEFIEAEKNYKPDRKKYKSCIQYNDSLKQKSKTITYYYARSKNNYLPILPPRPKNHGVYEINVSFGPLGGILEKYLTDAEKAIKNQLESEPCYQYGKDTTCYRMQGEDSHLYYTVRSILNSATTEKGKVSSPWKPRKFIDEESRTWQEIKGIEITQAQYDYMQTRCKGVFSCYLDDKAPDLTAEQKEYIKATAWELDTNVDARDALIKKAKKYRANEE